MNVIFHRNCLDGVFSSFIAFLASKLTTEDELSSFIQELKSFIASGVNDLTNCFPKTQPKQPKKSEQLELVQQFFHTPRGVYFNSYSFFAGEYYPLKFPVSTKLLLILDTNLATVENIQNVCQNHELVLMIDHHTSFAGMREELSRLQLKNFGYVFDEKVSAATLTENFLSRFLPFSKRLTPEYYHNLRQQLLFVSANDTKYGETKESKAFVLGFYYFGIELSHTNPNLYKRLGMLDLIYLLDRGTNLYASHLEQIRDEIRHAKIVEFTFNSPRFKGKKCMYVEPHNAYKISDIGNVLAFLSVKNGMENLCVLVMKNSSENRVSCRSHKLCKDPAALQLAKLFEGGGHTEAAGFKINGNRLKSSFKVHSLSKFGVNIQLDEDGG